MDNRHDQIPEAALRFARAGGGALATVIETWGSAPRQAGSQLAISASGEIMGSVSGGCVEGAVILEAQEAMADGQSRLLTYGVTDENAFAVGLACGGTIRVLVEPVGGAGGLPEALLSDLVEARARREALAYEVDFTHWTRRLTRETAADPALLARIRDNRSGPEGEGLVVVHAPPLRLIVVGAVHIAQALVPMARIAGYDPVLIDPRDVFAAQSRFPGERIVTDWPDEALEALKPDARTAVVTLTHDPKLDDPAILATLRSGAFYLGCLGSARTQESRRARLLAAGVNEADLARIHGPVGLRIGAKTPAEIAISILAEITSRLRAS